MGPLALCRPGPGAACPGKSPTAAGTWHGEPAGSRLEGMRTVTANLPAANLPAAQTPAANPPAAPTAPAVTADASTREAVLSSLLRHGELTAAKLAKLLGISVQAMRRHLRTLEVEGLVQASATTGGPGRPSYRWQLTAKAQDHFPDGSETFALGLMESLAQALPPHAIERLLSQQADAKAAAYRAHIGPGPLPQRLQQLVDLRRLEGFVAECSPDPDGQGWLMREFHCSVMRIAEQFPCVCDQELRLIRETFPDCQVDRVHWRLEKGHSCGFRLLPRPDAGETQSPQP